MGQSLSSIARGYSNVMRGMGVLDGGQKAVDAAQNGDALGFFRGLGQAVAMGTMGKNVCGWGTGAKLMTNGVIGAGAVAAGIDAVNKFGQGDVMGGIMSLGEGLLMASQLKACFVAGTPIRTPSGSKAIEELEVGDEILSRSEHQASGEVRTRRVLQKFVRTAPIVELSLAGRIIGTTAEHPFYAYDRGWVNAKELAEGDRVLTENGQWLRVDGIKDSGRVETVYNVEVEEDHTYFVGEAEWGWAVWAHNASYQRVGISDDLAQKALAFRAKLANPLTGRNIMAFEYVTKNGSLATKVLISNGKHTERMLKEGTKVLRIFTERQPCKNCFNFIEKYFPTTQVTYLFPYMDKAKRTPTYAIQSFFAKIFKINAS